MEQTGVGRSSEAGRGFEGARVVFCGRLRRKEARPVAGGAGQGLGARPVLCLEMVVREILEDGLPVSGRLALDHVRYTRVEGAPLASHQAGIDGLPGEGMAEGEVIGGDLDQELGRDQLLDGDDEGCFVEPA